MRQDEERPARRELREKHLRRLACRVGGGRVQAREGTQPMGWEEALENMVKAQSGGQGGCVRLGQGRWKMVRLAHPSSGGRWSK